jgi:hypothetical protein
MQSPMSTGEEQQLLGTDSPSRSSTGSEVSLIDEFPAEELCKTPAVGEAEVASSLPTGAAVVEPLWIPVLHSDMDKSMSSHRRYQANLQFWAAQTKVVDELLEQRKAELRALRDEVQGVRIRVRHYFRLVAAGASVPEVSHMLPRRTHMNVSLPRSSSYASTASPMLSRSSSDILADVDPRRWSPPPIKVQSMNTTTLLHQEP